MILRTANMILEILLKLKPLAPLARAFSVSVASMSSLRSASLLGESPDSVSSKNVGDFGIALWSFLALFRISSASSTKVGALWLTYAMIREGTTLLWKSYDILRLKIGMCQPPLSRALYVINQESMYD